MATLIAGTVAFAGPAPADWPQDAPPGHPYSRSQLSAAPRELWVVIEIPQGSAVKYEIDKSTGALFVDRFQSMPVHTPANYGSVPQTLGPDGDPLDAVVLSRHPVHPGTFMKVRPIGVLKTLDGEDPDDKILAVPVSAVDPTYDGTRHLTDVPPLERERIAAYFRVYKQLPSGLEGKLLDSGDAAAALRVIAEALARYQAAVAGAPTRPR
jgi:inorganic pyrophosphatase